MIAQRLIRKLSDAQMEILKSSTVALKVSNFRKHPRLAEMCQLIEGQLHPPSQPCSEGERNQRVLSILL